LPQSKKSPEDNQPPKSNKEWILWTLVAVFIVGAIGAMLTVDYFYAEDLNNPNKLEQAVGK
jgi:cytochrome c-type biogenesis protein CcmH/NrfF